MTSPIQPPSELDAAADGGGRGPVRPAWGAVAGLTPFASTAYRYLFVATMLTMSGYFMQQVAQGWLIYDLTGSPTWLGIVSFSGGIPMLVLSLPAGARRPPGSAHGPHRSSGLTALVAIILAGLIAWSSRGQAATAFLEGCFFVLIVPARQALLPATVARREFGAAIALMSARTRAGHRTVARPVCSWPRSAPRRHSAPRRDSSLALLSACMLVPRPASRQRGARRPGSP